MERFDGWFWKNMLLSSIQASVSSLFYHNYNRQKQKVSQAQSMMKVKTTSWFFLCYSDAREMELALTTASTALEEAGITFCMNHRCKPSHC